MHIRNTKKVKMNTFYFLFSILDHILINTHTLFPKYILKKKSKMAEQQNDQQNFQQDFTIDNFNTNIDNNFSSGDVIKNETDGGDENTNNNNSGEDNYENDNNQNNNGDNYEDEDDEDRLEPEQFRKLFIGSLNYVTSEETMRGYFGKFGDIVDCVIMKEPKTSKYV